MPPADDRTLLRAAAAGDRAAMDELVRRHGPLVLAACRRQLSAADADDAAQAVFLVLWRRADRAAAAPGLPGWLVVTAQRVCATARRAARRRRQAERAAAPADAPAELPNEARTLLDQALSVLPAMEREAVVRRHLLGEDPVAIASVLGCPAGTVHARTSRGLERLRAWFARRGIACSAAGLAALCADECAAAEAIPASTALTCATPSATAAALAASATAFPILLVGALTMSLAAIALIAVLSTPAAVTPASVAPDGPIVVKLYAVSDLYQAEVLIPYAQASKGVQETGPDPGPPPASDPATVAALDACRSMRDLCERLRARAGERAVVRLLDENLNDEDMAQDCPAGVTAYDLRVMLFNQTDPLFPDLDRNRTLLVAADRAGHARVEADLGEVRRRRSKQLQTELSAMRALTTLRVLYMELGMYRFQSDKPFDGDWSKAPTLPLRDLPTTIRNSPGFAVIWLPENHDAARPVAVACNGSESLIVTAVGVHWRPDLRPALVALDLRQRLDIGDIRAPLVYDHWRQAARAALLEKSMITRQGTPVANRLREDLAALVRQAAPAAEPTPEPAKTGF